MKHVILADSTRAMKQAVIDRDILPVLGNKMMAEITTSMVRDLCDRIVERGGRATAVQARRSSAAYTVTPMTVVMVCLILRLTLNLRLSPYLNHERTLTPEEIGLFFRTLDAIGAMGTMKMALKLVLITMVRKGEFTNATWDEIDFKKWTWTIPPDRMKGSRAHVIYLPKQAQDILVGLQMCAGGSEYLVPGRYNFRKPLSNAALNSLIDRTVKIINEDGEHIQDFTVHDMRRTASTLLHEAGYPSDWIEKALAHEQKGVRAVYNKAEYARQRAYMLQQWADMIDSWIDGEHTDLIPFSPVEV